MKGRLVAIEGIDGSGKTTLARSLAEGLSGLGWKVTSTREPTSGPWGRRIRASAVSGRMNPQDEMQAFIEDRREHVRDVIEPALTRGDVVVVDRYYLSSVAYQGARGLDPAFVLAQNESFAPTPHVAILLVETPSVALCRVQARGEADLFERIEDMRRVASVYDSLDLPWIVRIDAKTGPETVYEQALAVVAQKVGVARKA